MLAGLIVSSMGCANKLILHPLSGEDIYSGKNQGDFCFSKRYLDDVMQVKIENLNSR